MWAVAQRVGASSEKNAKQATNFIQGPLVSQITPKIQSQSCTNFIKGRAKKPYWSWRNFWVRERKNSEITLFDFEGCGETSPSLLKSVRRSKPGNAESLLHCSDREPLIERISYLRELSLARFNPYLAASLGSVLWNYAMFHLRKNIISSIIVS